MSATLSTGSPSGSGAAPDAELGLAHPDDVPVPYMKRTRDWYLTLGYGNPYRWAQFSSVPFTKLTKPLSECRLGLVTTAAPYQPECGDQGPDAAYNASAKFYTVYTDTTEVDPDLRISHLGYDRKHTRPSDQNAYVPLPQLREVDEAGRIGSLSPRFYGAPTNRSQAATISKDCVDIERYCREDEVDVALIVAN